MADINRAVYDDRHYLVGIALLNLGEIYLNQGNLARAEQFYREALSRFTEKLPAGRLHTALAQLRLGHALLPERRYKEAEGDLWAGYEALLKQPGPQAACLQSVCKDLIALYEAVKRPDQADKFRAELAARTAEHASKSN